MSFTIQSFSHWCAQCASQLLGTGGALAIAMGVTLSGSRAVAAENIVLTYGIFNETISVESLKTLVETGETTATLDFLFDIMDITPKTASNVLQQDIEVSVRFIDDVLYSLPGEFALFQMGQIFHNRGRVASIQALRSALTLSASEDSNLTLLEFFEKYPNPDLYVDGALLADVASEASEFVEKTGRSLAVPIAIIKDLLNSVVCDCGTQSSNFLEETDDFVLR
jgi:Alpha/beta hydrolase of unknown function (DUF1400)